MGKRTATSLATPEGNPVGKCEVCRKKKTLSNGRCEVCAGQLEIAFPAVRDSSGRFVKAGW
ncbi:hypothetical protein [Longispora albida]|uniref:hypothetical protein n=1 Tax=Longispora albida TaxID=203523 RepID=UPI00036F1630|nr:hypothetical protein [Longispora albida]